MRCGSGAGGGIGFLICLDVMHCVPGSGLDFGEIFIAMDFFSCKVKIRPHKKLLINFSVIFHLSL